MRGIDISNWEEFRIGDIFETVNKGKQVPTGASIAKAELKENGAIPRISVSGVNNGIVGLYDYTGVSNHNYRVYNNFVSVSFLGTVFYHGGSASLDMKVHCLKPKNIVLNNYTGHFLVTAIKTSLRQSSYSDQISSSVLPNLHILLPSTTSHQPDWEFMENYMVSIEKKVKENFVLLTHVSSCKKNVIDTTNWRRFHLYDDDLFTIDSGTKLDKVKMSNKNPSVNFVGRANANNGVTDYVDEIEGVKPFEAGCLQKEIRLRRRYNSRDQYGFRCRHRSGFQNQCSAHNSETRGISRRRFRPEDLRHSGYSRKG